MEVIERKLDVIKTAEWIIDMGPEGGARGGEVIAASTPEDIVMVEKFCAGYYSNVFSLKNKIPELFRAQHLFLTKELGVAEVDCKIGIYLL